MFYQICQRCGYVFDTDTTLGTEADLFDEVNVSVFMDNWSRNWVLCEPCAARLFERLESFFGLPQNEDVIAEAIRAWEIWGKK